MNAHAERWVRSVKDEALSKLILVGESSLRHALRDYLTHYHEERNHQGKGNVLLFPSRQEPTGCLEHSVRCRERLGGVCSSTTIARPPEGTTTCHGLQSDRFGAAKGIDL